MKKEIIILYVMDALRADRLGCYGYDKPTSSNIDALADSGVVYENVYSQSTETKSSAATIFTSTYLSVHKTSAHTDILPSGLVTLAESLKESGYVTASFNTNIRLGAEFGFDRGVDCHFDLHTRSEFDNVNALPCSGLINKELLSWLEREDNEKIFLTVWSMDTHLPWFPPQEFTNKFTDEEYTSIPGTMASIIDAKDSADFGHLENLYDAEIAYNDYNIGQLIKQLENMGLWQHTTFILTADHGEMFREHGHFMYHGGAPYREVTHVPLIIKSPGIVAGREKKLGGLIDLMPTILGLATISYPGTVQGKDILGDSVSRYVYSESKQKDFKDSVAVFDTEWKLIKSDIPKNLLKNKILKKPLREVDAAKIEHPPGVKDLHKGISPLMLKKAKLQNFKNEYVGSMPVAGGSFLLWFKQLYLHFFSATRLELFDIKDDFFEKRNVVCDNPSITSEFLKKLVEFEKANDDLSAKLKLSKNQMTLEGDLEERLKHLGYL